MVFQSYFIGKFWLITYRGNFFDHEILISTEKKKWYFGESVKQSWYRNCKQSIKLLLLLLLLSTFYQQSTVQLCTVKIVSDCQDSKRLSRQLQTVADCLDNCTQLQTFADMYVLVCLDRGPPPFIRVACRLAKDPGQKSKI